MSKEKMILAKIEDWKAVHLKDRVVLKKDACYWLGYDWMEFIACTEVEPMEEPGHYKAVY